MLYWVITRVVCRLLVKSFSPRIECDYLLGDKNVFYCTYITWQLHINTNTFMRIYYMVLFFFFLRAPAEPNLIEHRCARNARIKWFCAPVEMASTRYCDRKSNNKCSLEPKCNIIYNAMQWRVGKIGSQFCFYHSNQLEICSFVKYSSRCSCWLWKVCLCLFCTVEWVWFTRQKPYRVERSKWFNTDKVKESQAWHRVKTLVHFHLRAYVLFVCLMIVQLCLSRWLQWCVVCITIAGCRSIVMHESHSMV